MVPGYPFYRGVQSAYANNQQLKNIITIIFCSQFKETPCQKKSNLIYF